MDLHKAHTATDLTAQIDAMLQGWALEDAQRAALRGCDESPELQASRLSQLRMIVGGLYLLFPENPELRRDWVQRDNAALGGRSPMQVILTQDDGLPVVARG